METFIPLSKPDLTGNELKYVTDVIQSGWITHKGKYVFEFEQEFSKYIDKQSISCSSGTAALHLALLACGIGEGDEVLVPDLTFANTASVVKHVGATPILVDVNKDFCIDVEQIKKKINHKTKAIIPVHLYGIKCDMKSINTLAHFHKLFVIEDCCEALWIKPTGDFAAYSFYGNKTITTGEGGMLCGQDLQLAKHYRDGAFDSEYYHSLHGLNYRMTNLQAAVGCAQLERIDEFVEKTFTNAWRFYQKLSGKGKWLFVTQVSDPKFMKYNLMCCGIETRPVFWPLHKMDCYKQDESYPISTGLWKHGICLPTGPHLSSKDIDFICEKVEQFTEERYLECR